MNQGFFRRFIFTFFLVSFIVFLSLTPFGLSHKVARSAAICPENELTGGPWGSVYLAMYAYYYYTRGCDIDPSPHTDAFVANCGYGYSNVNVDAWVTRTWPGGTRYGESGRTGDITYPADCSNYWATSAGPFPTYLPEPVYGCGWYLVDDKSSQDYICPQVGVPYNGNVSSISSATGAKDTATKSTDIGSTFTTESGLQITLVQLDVSNKQQLRFHFRISNLTKNSVSLSETGTDNRFYLGIGTQLISISAVSGADATKYPSLPKSLVGGAIEDGWAAVATSAGNLSSMQILYRYATIPSRRCSTPAVPSTCIPYNLFKSVIWNIANVA